MKSTLAIVALYITATSAFTAAPRTVVTKTSALKMGGFLEGKGNRITIRDDEDDAMWIEDPKDKKTRLPGSGKKKEAPKKPEAKKSAGFKFPWDK